MSDAPTTANVERILRRFAAHPMEGIGEAWRKTRGCSEADRVAAGWAASQAQERIKDATRDDEVHRGGRFEDVPEIATLALEMWQRGEVELAPQRVESPVAEAAPPPVESPVAEAAPPPVEVLSRHGAWVVGPHREWAGYQAVYHEATGWMAAWTARRHADVPAFAGRLRSTLRKHMGLTDGAQAALRGDELGSAVERALAIIHTEDRGGYVPTPRQRSTAR